MDKMAPGDIGEVAKEYAFPVRRVNCGCGCGKLVLCDGNDGLPRFATPNCSLAWYNEHKPELVISCMSGLRS